MLSNAGVAVLEALTSGREATPEALASEAGYSREHVYRVLDDLLAAGLLFESRGTNNRRRVRVADHPVVEAYRHLDVNLGHVEWPELLTPATIRVSWYLDEPRRVPTIADRLGISRQAVYDVVSPLKHRAMLSPAGPEYALADDVRPLLSFVRAVVEHEHRARVRQLAAGATVEWSDPRRALVRAHEPDGTDALRAADDWQLTGLAKFRDFGLRFYTSGEPAFWYGPDELTAPEVVCHALLVERDSRRTSYAMLLIERAGIDEERLASVASWYGLERAVTVMYEAIDGNFDRTDDGAVRLPSESEYEALKSEYAVT